MREKNLMVQLFSHVAGLCMEDREGNPPCPPFSKGGLRAVALASQYEDTLTPFSKGGD